MEHKLLDIIYGENCEKETHLESKRKHSSS